MRTALIHAHVVVGNGQTIDDGLVVLDGGRIERVMSNNKGVDGSFAVSYTHLTLPTNREV